MSTPPLHVVFTDSGAGSLRTAIAEAGRKDRVICYPDNLQFGPINPPDPELRRIWVEEQLGWTDWLERADEEAFWTASISHEGRRIVWMSRRDVAEYTGFLEWLRRLGDTPCDVVDLSDVRVTWRSRDGKLMSPSPAVCLAMLSPGQIVENGLLDSAQTLPPAERRKYIALWERLRTENAPFRILGEEGLQSAPITFFDRPLLSYVTADWQKIARVVCYVLADAAEDARFQTGDLVLVSRMWALIDAGLLESRGDVSNIRSGEVRLPDARGPDIVT